MTIRPFRLSVLTLSLFIPAALCAVVLFLVIYSGQAILFNGLHFITDINWNLGDLYDDPVTVNGISVPSGANYGIWVFIAGTLASSTIAILIAVPLSVGAAIFLAEAVSPKIRPILSLLVELIAVIPSVVFGLWGIAVLVPFISHYLSPTGNGYGLLAASIVLALMITPIIASTLLDALMQVPRENRESAFALGATHFEVVAKAMMPMVRTTLVGGIVLALGRALGETMAVLMVSGGGINILPDSLFSPISTIASFVVSQLDSAQADPTNMSVRALSEVALVLFVITLAVNAAAKLLASGALNVRNRK
ncbi:phosphate transport system permease protein PstC 1 [Acidocella aquatica]|uniref:Phosphate transport system permease protein n=1 Tax=Acidocella aquatica TaxID=1922313 RepID=A0ABQ6ADS7_9PROT|nr:phosphate ABC transporter permease subunit PstC [Acidocella aquatica]GLR68797.1 phosphate transport system permease protein PstC 1 [Acidocella aquatica]